jgi:hypothetical protein
MGSGSVCFPVGKKSVDVCVTTPAIDGIESAVGCVLYDANDE